MTNLYNGSGKVNDNQNVYDNFNNFILSDDKNVFNKLVARNNLYAMVLKNNIIGDIVECGVFKGSGLATWLKLLEMFEPNSIKKVIGFDFFEPQQTLISIDDKLEYETMAQVFTRDKKLDIVNDLSIESIQKKLSSISKEDRFELVKGNIIETSKKFTEERPGLRISILYMDLDLDEPTYETMKNLYDKVSPGGIIVFDEYAYHSWSESNGVDRFIREYGLKLIPSNIKAPTAFCFKP